MVQNVFVVSLILVSIAFGEVHVAPDGADQNAGTKADPVATIKRAVAIADDRGGEQTIILHAGVYRENVQIYVLEDAPPLTITAMPDKNGGFEHVVFEGGYAVDDAEPVEGMPGVYRVPIPTRYNAYRSRRAMWEVDTRTRYRRLADVRAVAAYPASYRFEPVEFFSDQGWLYFHTSDSQPPASHEIGYSISDYGVHIHRDKVTLRGLHFQNGFGVSVVGDNALIEDCSSWNIERMAIYISASCPRATIRRFTATDVGAGIYSEAGHTVVEDCRLFRARDRFESHAKTQMDSAGIQIYAPGETGEIRGNLTVGFRTGIFIKKTSKASVIVEHNTCYGGEGGAESGGITFVRWYDRSVMRYNIVSGHDDAYPVWFFTRYGHNVIFRDNLLWDVNRKENITECFTIPQAAGTGQGIVMADPRFAAPVLGDFRLLPGSPVLRGNDVQIGAFGRVPDDWKDAQPPTISLSLADPATRLGRTVEHYWRSDHWHEGGGLRELRKTTFENDADNPWLIPASQINLKLAVTDNASKVTQMKLRIGNGKWSEAMPFQWSLQRDLPAHETDTTIAMRVADAAGNWSQPATLRVFRADTAPQIVGEPYVYVTRQGVVVAFKTNVPCTARLEWGVGEELDQVAHRAPDVYCNWGADDAEWSEVRFGPRQDHTLAVQAPDIKPGTTVNYRIVLDDGVGHVHRTDIARVALAGEPRMIVIAPNGKDGDGAAQPWCTLQFAVDRALPGDRIVLRDGLYPGMTTILRGGAPGTPLVIEAENAGKATIDTGKMRRNAIRINEVEHVTLRGLEIRWFIGNGIQITDSSHVTLDQLTIWLEHVIKGRRHGAAFQARRSPRLTVRRCLLFGMNENFSILDSPGFRFEQNTVASGIHRGCRIIFSTRGSTMINNCFAFNSNEHIQAYERRSDWETFTCDYNLYASIIRDLAPRRPAPEVDIRRFPGSLWARTGKGVNRVNFAKPGGRWEKLRSFSFAEWQDISGKETHSIYKRPLFVDPMENDWRLRPDSPNIGAGKDGALIGATEPIAADASRN